ncbi:hypothetical protein [Olleya namhaensis]|uniref:Uncharacterized protein n=1 Tax=Olleya namhaensis TaxID=1144750 RepID=A0A1I3RZW4_9FLAO|nr:hypothetical protein [Olleya namhaensis]SFJ50841.1 hypothetical protein SAMN05443431_108202 [Olleya namhaensis]
MRFSLILLFLLSLSTIQAQQNNDQSTTSDDYLQVTRYRLDPEDLDIDKEVDTEKVYIKIYYNKTASVSDDYKYFKPKANEILFFYGINKNNNQSEMFFKVDDSLKPIYQKKNFEQLMQVIKVLEYNIFSEDKFSSAEAYAALERV